MSMMPPGAIRYIGWRLIHPSAWRDCMKTPDTCGTGTPPSAENGPTGLYFGVSCYRRATIRASPTTFHTVSEGEFSEVGLPLYGVLRSSHSASPTPLGAPGRDC